MDFEKIGSVMEDAREGSLIDDTLDAQVGNLSGNLTGMIGQLNASGIDGISEITASLNSGVASGGLDSLAGHLSDTKGEFMNRLSTLGSFTSMKDALGGLTGKTKASLPEILPATLPEGLSPIAQAASGSDEGEGNTKPAVSPFLKDAFGAALTARSMLTKVSSLTSKLGALGGLSSALQTANAALVTAQNAFGAGQITKDQLDAATAEKDEAEKVLNSTKTSIKTMAGELSENVSGIADTISKEKDFHDNAAKELDAFASAMKIVSMKDDPTARAVLGAIGSSSLLGKLA